AGLGPYNANQYGINSPNAIDPPINVVGKLCSTNSKTLSYCSGLNVDLLTYSS
ncbi:hypothetical protein D041_4278B, partial [Vibrio parahaemolyticus EKP-008]